MGVELPQHSAAHDANPRKRERQIRCAERDALEAGGIDYAVGDLDDDGIGHHFIGNDLNRTDDAVVDHQFGARIDEFDAGFAGPLRLAIAIDPPAGHQRAMADGDIAQVALACVAVAAGWIHTADLQPAPGDEQAVEREAAALLAGDGEGVCLVDHVVEQAQHRPIAIACAYLQALAGLERDRERLGVDRAVADLDHRGAQALLRHLPYVPGFWIGGRRP